MSDVATLKSYLVSLGFQVDAPSLGQFSKVLGDTAHLVEGSTASIVVNIAKWTSGIITLFTAVSAATLTAMDKVAMADQEYRLFGERMFMDTAHAKALKVALDALGEPLEAIAFDPELHARFDRLIEVQKQLAAGLGPGFESSMKSIRDVRFELTLLEVELEYITQGAVAELFKQLGLGDGSVLGALRSINAWVVQHAPEISRAFASYIVPVLKDTWMILTDVVHLFEALARGFTNFIAAITGDSSLSSTAFNFDKFARAIDKCVNGVAHLVDGIVRLAGILTPVAGTLTGLVIGSLFGGVAGAAIGAAGGAAAGPAGMVAGAATGGFAGIGTGALIGGGAGALYDILSAIGGNLGGGGQSSGIAAQAHTLAGQISASTGISPDILYAQWAHETGNFTNRGATQLNNLAGIKLPGSDEYRSFASLQDFGNYYNSLLHSSRYSSALGAKSIDQFASALKQGGYMSDTLNNYERGMRRYTPSSSTGANVNNSVSIGDVHITQPAASADDIANTVISKVRQMQRMQTQRNLAELTTVYG